MKCLHTLLHTHTLPSHPFTLPLNTVILCLLMGTGSSVPRVPLDNWLLSHLLTSPPLTFLHFTFKVLHFFSPLTSSSCLRPLTYNTCSCIFLHRFYIVFLDHLVQKHFQPYWCCNAYFYSYDGSSFCSSFFLNSICHEGQLAR